MKKIDLEAEIYHLYPKTDEKKRKETAFSLGSRAQTSAAHSRTTTRRPRANGDCQVLNSLTRRGVFFNCLLTSSIAKIMWRAAAVPIPHIPARCPNARRPSRRCSGESGWKTLRRWRAPQGRGSGGGPEKKRRACAVAANEGEWWTATGDDNGRDEQQQYLWQHDQGQGQNQQQSSWTAREASQDAKGVDYLVELGKQSANMNTEVGARNGMVDDVFAGTANANFNLGADSDIASGELRYRDQARSFGNIVGDYHVPPQFMDRVALHVAKNLMVDAANPGAEDNPMGSTRVPLILGIWGSKVGLDARVGRVLPLTHGSKPRRLVTR